MPWPFCVTWPFQGHRSAEVERLGANTGLIAWRTIVHEDVGDEPTCRETRAREGPKAGVAVFRTKDRTWDGLCRGSRAVGIRHVLACAPRRRPTSTPGGASKRKDHGRIHYAHVGPDTPIAGSGRLAQHLSQRLAA